MTPKTIQDKKAALAQKAGVAPKEVGAVRLQLQKLQTEGVLVDVDFDGATCTCPWMTPHFVAPVWGQNGARHTKWFLDKCTFTTRATYQELGIPHGDVRRQRIRAGNKDVIPTLYLKKLRSLEIRFRQSTVLYPVPCVLGHHTGPYGPVPQDQGLVGQDEGGQYRALSCRPVQGLDKYSFQSGSVIGSRGAGKGALAWANTGPWEKTANSVGCRGPGSLLCGGLAVATVGLAPTSRR